MRSALDMRRLDAAVGSAGLLPGGAPAVDNAIAAVKSLGLDLQGHLSRRIDPEIIGWSDLILTMERMHVREIVTVEPGAFAKTFTMVDFVERAANKWPVGASLGEKLAAIGADRRPSELMGRGKDEIADPIGQSLEVFERTRDELVVLTKKVAALLAA